MRECGRPAGVAMIDCATAAMARKRSQESLPASCRGYVAAEAYVGARFSSANAVQKNQTLRLVRSVRLNGRKASCPNLAELEFGPTTPAGRAKARPYVCWYRLEQEPHAQTALQPGVVEVVHAVARIDGVGAVGRRGNQRVVVVPVRQVRVRQVDLRAGPPRTVEAVEDVARRLLVEQVLDVRFEPHPLAACHLDVV